MSVVISQNFVAGLDGEYAAANANNPLVGYETRLSIDNVIATSEQANYPATNLANPATNLLWKSEVVAEVYVEVVLDDVEPVDYVAIAAHNLGTGLIPVSVEGLVDGSASPADWVELTTDVLLPDDGPALFRFTSQSLYAVRLRMQASSNATVPQIAVMYVGKLLVLQRRIYVGHTPIKYGRTTRVINNRSESGNFLGRIVLGEATQTSVSLQNMTATWFRSYLNPFLLAAREAPFFFAWRPSSYPNEVGYAWLSGDVLPVNQRANGMMSVELPLGGIV